MPARDNRIYKRIALLLAQSTADSRAAPAPFRTHPTLTRSTPTSAEVGRAQ